MSIARAELHTMDDLLAQAWERVGTKLQTLYGDNLYRSWLKPMQFLGSDEGRIKLSVPTRFIRERINSYYIAQVEKFWHEEQVAEGYALELIVSAPIPALVAGSKE